MPRSRRVALVAAPLATVLAIGAGVAATGTRLSPVEPQNAQASLTVASIPVHREAPERTLGTSRSLDRVPLVNHRKPVARDTMWTTAALKLRVEPRDRSEVAGTVPARRKVELTGSHQGPYAEVVTGKLTRWVTAAYLSQKKPAPPKPARAASSGSSSSSSSASTGGLSSAPCPDGSSVESGLQPAAVRLYRAVCAAFPELTTYGGLDGHGEHATGQAVDFMVSSSSLGNAVKDFVYAHRAELGVYDIIWAQHIWTVDRAGEGFRYMSDRGSATANHYDHVHVMVQ